MPVFKSNGDVWPGQMKKTMGPAGKKNNNKKMTNCDQMMWKLEPSKLWFCTCLEAFALQIAVLGDSVCVVMAVGTWSDHEINSREEKPRLVPSFPEFQPRWFSDNMTSLKFFFFN